MKVGRLYRIIDQARASDADTLASYVGRAASTPDAELSRLTAQVMNLILDVPPLLAGVAEAAEIRGIGLLVQPMLDHAADYFLNPLDHAPELAFGVPGLLDDAYLALRIVDLIQQIHGPLVATDVRARLALLSRLLGRDLLEELDAEVGRALVHLVMHVAALRQWADGRR